MTYRDNPTALTVYADSLSDAFADELWRLEQVKNTISAYFAGDGLEDHFQVQLFDSLTSKPEEWEVGPYVMATAFYLDQRTDTIGYETEDQLAYGAYNKSLKIMLTLTKTFLGHMVSIYFVDAYTSTDIPIVVRDNVHVVNNKMLYKTIKNLNMIKVSKSR